MAFRKSVPQEELRGAMSEEQLDRQATTYQASRGGWFPAEGKPVPGAGREEADD